MKKKVFQNKDINLTRKKLLQVYINKYFNLFMNSIEFTNLDYNQQDYIMRIMYLILLHISNLQY